MKLDALISVIVPVYNVENYLRQCISSLLSQSYTHFELLIVDDGSTDQSGMICDEYASQDSRIRVVHKNNGGVSSARNFGLDMAKGEYICFVDSDDWVQKDYLKDLLRYSKEGVDFIISDYMYVNGSYHYLPPTPSAVVGGVEILLSDYSRLRSCYSPYGKLFRLSIIRKYNLYFDVFVHYGEDRLFNFNYLRYVNQVAISSGINYCYCRREGSLIYKQYDFEQEFYAYRKSQELIREFIQEKNIRNPEIISLLNAMTCDFANRLINVIYHSSEWNYKERMGLLKRIDTRMMGKYMYPMNTKERIIKWLLYLGLASVHDLLRTIKTN